MTKNDILIRLLKQGYITLDEMLILEQQTQQLVYVPYIQDMNNPWVITSTDVEVTVHTDDAIYDYRIDDAFKPYDPAEYKEKH